MKKSFFTKGIFLLFLAFQFMACDNEPLVGDFPADEPLGPIPGSFTAMIGNVRFKATGAMADLDSDNMLTISGSKTPKNITLIVKNLAVQAYDLTNSDTNPNKGIYKENADSPNYVSLGDMGGSGEMKITAIDTLKNTISGNFSFIAVRAKEDKQGAPVLDEEGNPVIEEVKITDGKFIEIPLLK